jgi:hypothetical protein
MKKENVSLLDIIFNNFKFYDKDFILQLLLYYKNKTAMSTSYLPHQISEENFKISTSDENSSNNCIYLYNECRKKNVNIYIIKYKILSSTFSKCK